jgi:hypothetical protein
MDSDSARRLRQFAAVFTFILGVSSLMLWYVVLLAASQYDWQLTLTMPFGEGFFELVVMQVILAFVLLGMVGFHELLARSPPKTESTESEPSQNTPP